MQWDGPSSSIYATFGPQFLTADASVNNPVSSTNIRATAEKDAGKYYLEFLYNRIGGGFLPHILLLGAAAFPYRTGFIPINEPIAYGWGFRASGDAYVDGTLLSGYLPAINVGDVAQVAIDIGTGAIWFGVNNSFVGSPSAGTSPAASNLSSSSSTGENGEPARIGLGAHAAVAATLGYLNGAADYGSLTARFKAADWQYSPPSGFGEWAP